MRELETIITEPQTKATQPVSILGNKILQETYWPSGSSYGVIGIFEYAVSGFIMRKRAVRARLAWSKFQYPMVTMGE